ncbi:F-box protein CPR1-like [Silene latifolia]|uniref:F-box protein CPR1-like n=1 Tax=Silene latifolia TaxID=37657 RepID=UPI003D782B4F
MAEKTLPFDIITEILTRLPVKPLTRFKSVSKLWNSLINSPNFIKLHLSKTLISENQNPNLICSSFSIFTATITNAAIFRFTELHHPLLQFPDYHCVKILGSCNGVVCISSFDGAYICLYNPTTGSHQLLPVQPSRFPKPNPETIFRAHDHRPKTEEHLFVYGFGYDSVNDDYKLVRILEFYRNSVFVGTEVCMFSLKNYSWKYIDIVGNVYLNYGGLQECNAALFNEVLYFIVNDGKITPFVRCFNLQTETFSIMDLPKFDDNFFMFCLAMGQVGGCLSFFVNYNNVDHGASNYSRLMRADFWIMKEGSWVRLFSISDTSSIGASVDIIALVYSKDRQKILLNLDGRVFGWYDWEKRSIVRALVHGLPLYTASFNFDTWTYVESLVSFGNRNYNSKGKTTVPTKKKKNDVDRFLSSGFKLKL